MSFAARLLNVFAIPGEVFAGVKAGRVCVWNWLVPALLLTTVAVLTAVVVVSQSGASVEIVRLLGIIARAVEVIGITNTPGSPLAERAGVTLCTRAGPESTVSSKTSELEHPRQKRGRVIWIIVALVIVTGAILGLTEAFLADPSPDKVNLGVGVYQDDSGKVPVLDVVREAEKRWLAKEETKTYLPIDGVPAYNAAPHLPTPNATRWLKHE